MDDQDIIQRINSLAAEEHELFQREAGDTSTYSERERLKQIEVTLDQCWDLLHQRRARRNAGMNPDEAALRPPDMVEGYLG